MATINYAAREISVKIVYYGPGLSGKTTNLQVIHRKIPKESKTEMISLATETDRTLFFDFLPLDLGKIRGFTTKFQLYTVPGQVYYNATRKLVLRGVDGIVFVADSSAEKLNENLESFKNMEENLAEYRYQRELIPIVLQYNKQDLPNALPCQYLNTQLNKYSLQWNDAVANKGKGVFESLKLIGKLVIDQLNQRYAPQSAASKSQPAPVTPPKPQQSSPEPIIMPAYQQQPQQPFLQQQMLNPMQQQSSYVDQQAKQIFQNPEEAFGIRAEEKPAPQPPQTGGAFIYEQVGKNEVDREVDRYYTGADQQSGPKTNIQGLNQSQTQQPIFPQAQPQQSFGAGQGQQPMPQQPGGRFPQQPVQPSSPFTPNRQPQATTPLQPQPSQFFNQNQQPFGTVHQPDMYMNPQPAPEPAFGSAPQNPYPTTATQPFANFLETAPQQKPAQADPTELVFESPMPHANQTQQPLPSSPFGTTQGQGQGPMGQPFANQNQYYQQGGQPGASSGDRVDSFYELENLQYSPTQQNSYDQQQHYQQQQQQQAFGQYNQAMNQPGEQEQEEDDDDMFFTSVKGERSRKKSKKPVNPKLQPKQSFFARLLRFLGLSR
ncbi:MAG: hypothetical protein JW795_04220 [Chitinivibrionales bacterium]|nr:hypothetical protein [Chitinivibrionales bacterium]